MNSNYSQLVKDPQPVFEKPSRRTGLILIGLALAGLLYFLSPIIGTKLKKQEKTSFGDILGNTIDSRPRIISTVVEAKESEEVRDFYLTIEKTGLFSAPIISNINIENDDEYKQALKKGLVHPRGNAYPGEGSLVYIFGHSTNHFWNIANINGLLFGIEKLEKGDKIKVEYNGEHYVYHVFDKKIISKKDIDYVKEREGQDILVLQSCWPPGTALKRVLILAKPSKFASLIY